MLWISKYTHLRFWRILRFIYRRKKEWMYRISINKWQYEMLLYYHVIYTMFSVNDLFWKFFWSSFKLVLISAMWLVLSSSAISLTQIQQSNISDLYKINNKTVTHKCNQTQKGIVIVKCRHSREVPTAKYRNVFLNLLFCLRQ